MPLPKYTTRASFELEPGAVGHTADFKETHKRLEWGLKKIVDGSEHTLCAKLTFSMESHGNITKASGPVSMTFTIPMYNASRLQVRVLNFVLAFQDTTTEGFCTCILIPLWDCVHQDCFVLLSFECSIESFTAMLLYCDLVLI